MSAHPDPSTQTKRRHVGRAVLRVEDPPLLRGAGKFIDDLPVTRRTHHAAILRSPHAHARIVSIDTSAASSLPGVSAVVTGDDIKRYVKPLVVGFKNDIDYRGIALDRVRYVGEPVAVVCAADRYLAEDALDLIRVEYELLEAVVDPVAAAADDAVVLHPAASSNVVSKRTFTHGQVDPAFEKATHRSELTIRYPRNSVTPMETYAVIAEYLSDTDGYDVMSNFQGPFSVHTVMAIALGVPGSRLRHRSPSHSGGSFGSKLTIFPYIVVLCVASRLARRPIKWIEDRLEHLSAANSAPNRVTRIEAAYDADGVVDALRLHHWDDHGAYLRAPMPAPIYRMHGLSTNGYGIGSVEVVNHIMVTNKCPTGAVRGFGGPQLYYAIERMMHKIAVELGLDPLDVIKKNLLPANVFPYRTPAGALIDSGNYQLTMQEAETQGGLEELKRRREQARAEGRLYGIGYAAVVEPSQSNMGYISTLKTAAERERTGPKDGAVANVTVSVDALGSVSVVGDSVPQGQGHQTVLAQIVADCLGLEIDDITVNLETDTQKDGWSIAAGNYSCRFAPAVTSAADAAACKVRDKLARIAAQRLNVSPDRVEFVGGRIQAHGNPDNSLEFRRVGGLAHWSPSSLPDDEESGVRETSSWNAPELTPTNANDEINTSLAYGFGFDFCGIEIDRDTATVRIDKYVTAHDCGTILNPGIAEGQIRGSFASALGAALYEEFVYDADGSFKSGTFAEYLVVTAPEVPELVIVHPTPHPSPFTRLGAKGIAEGNQYSTPVCLANAAADALNHEHIELPLTPARISEWLNEPEPSAPADAEPPQPTADNKSSLRGEGEASLAAAPEQIWAMLLDPEILSSVIPGCRELIADAEHSYRGVLSLGVGPVRGQFDTRISLSDLRESESLTLNGALTGPLGSSHGIGWVTLEPQQDGTLLRYRYEIRLAGKVAAVGGRMLNGAARTLFAQFFKALGRKAAGDTPPIDPPPSAKKSWRQRIGLKS